MSKSEFLARFQQMASTFGSDASPELYWAHLTDFDFELVKRAMTELAGESKWMPRPIELIDRCKDLRGDFQRTENPTTSRRFRCHLCKDAHILLVWMPEPTMVDCRRMVLGEIDEHKITWSTGGIYCNCHGASDKREKAIEGRSTMRRYRNDPERGLPVQYDPEKPWILIGGKTEKASKEAALSWALKFTPSFPEAQEWAP